MEDGGGGPVYLSDEICNGPATHSRPSAGRKWQKPEPDQMPGAAVRHTDQQSGRIVFRRLQITPQHQLEGEHKELWGMRVMIFIAPSP